MNQSTTPPIGSRLGKITRQLSRRSIRKVTTTVDASSTILPARQLGVDSLGPRLCCAAPILIENAIPAGIHLEKKGRDPPAKLLSIAVLPADHALNPLKYWPLTNESFSYVSKTPDALAVASMQLPFARFISFLSFCSHMSGSENIQSNNGPLRLQHQSLFSSFKALLVRNGDRLPVDSSTHDMNNKTIDNNRHYISL